MTNQEIVELYEGFSMTGDWKLPAKTAYTMLRNKQLLENYIKTIEECRLEIIRQYANIIGDCYQVPTENQEIFKKEMDELYTFDNEDIQLHKIKLPDDFIVSFDTLERLAPMISEED